MDSSEQPTQPSSPYDTDFMLILGMVCLVVLGLTLALFSVAYIKDLQTLRNVPNLVWNFACGKPIDNDITLPLLLTLSILSFLGTGILYGVRRWLGRNQTTETNGEMS